MAYYLMPPDQKPASIAPFLLDYKNSTNGNTPNGASIHAHRPPPALEPHNLTVVRTALLSRLHWTFLIRHPRSSVPSYYRCTIPPLAAVAGWSHYLPSEVGYGELRRLFDYLRGVGIVGGPPGEDGSKADICVIDADDLMDDPAGVIRRYCESVGIEFSPGDVELG